jgi:hypothetical protein
MRPGTTINPASSLPLLLLLQASFGTLITFYCLLCFMLVSFICVPVLDIR